ncbi:MAG TPA: hypothetical protein VM737_09455 [Gemmatimonadota bacterium]|nr:hypothetical protein [Gemmatimonadota bacterium]
MAKRVCTASVAFLACWIAASWAARPPAVHAQDVRPLAPIREPAEPGDPPAVEDAGREGEPAGAEPALIPLPQAASRAVAASGDRVRVAAVLPASWSDVVAGYQPAWTGIASAGGFGLQGWTAYFAAAGLVAAPSPHPFFGPWGMLAYEGWLFERYRSVWTAPGAAELRYGEDAAEWLQRGDYAMATVRPAEAAHAYRRVTQAAPDFPLGYLGLGAALSELADDEAAALAFRQALDRYPAWLTLTMDWTLLYPGAERLAAVQAAAAERAEDRSGRLVAGILHLFGDRAEQGRAFLRTLADDPHAELLLTRSLP